MQGYEHNGSAEQTGDIKTVAAASMVGTSIEFYDYYLYGIAAALVFPALFFPDFSATAGLLASFATFAAGFFVRPLGGVVFGHFGDRIGRKKILVLTLVLMGVATFGVGLLPTYGAIGIWAPVLLVVLRLVQGIAVSGEWGGAVLMAVEHAPKRRRGFFGSFAEMGVPAGVTLSSGAFLAASALPEEQFLAWGWRLPFLASLALVAVGLYVRLKILETPAFEKVRRAQEISRVPILDVLRRNLGTVALVTGAFAIINATFFILITFALSYATETVGVQTSTILTVVAISGAVNLLAVPAFAALSDRFGRKPVYLTGVVGMAGGAYLLFPFLNTGVLLWMALGHTLCMALMNLASGPKGTFYTEQFETRVRYTGASLSYSLGLILGGALSPIVATALLSSTGTTLAISAYLTALAALAFVCTLLLKETYKSDIQSRPLPPQRTLNLTEGRRA